MSGTPGVNYYNAASDAQMESRYTRAKKLFVEHPLVPLGIVLFNGARKMRSNNGTSMQKMMRWRIYGQGASLAMLAYLSFKVHNAYKKEVAEDPPLE
uniref:HIG1 domain-containing protein n=1 Tax=Mesocestoides corti TaxID=53468 RepID=A0A5K3EK14_MESCO